MFVRPKLTIYLNKIVENYKTFSKARQNENTIIAAVVKDNAYGLGAEQVTDALYRLGECRTFFVAYAREGHLIRPYASDADIYVLQGPGEDELDYYRLDNLIPVINTPKQWTLWKKDKPNENRPAIQIETGLNRLGFSEEEIKALPTKERDEFGLVLSHLACADEPKNKLNQKQLDTFKKLKSYFKKAKFSLSASDGFLLGEEFHFDIARLGAVLYGINPIEKALPKSQNVIRLQAPIIQIKSVKAGESVGYGSAYIAKDNIKIAVVSIGYGDGIFRSLESNGKVWFQTNEEALSAPIIGRVSMDNIMIDITNIKSEILNNNQYVVLINSSYTLDDFGTDADTIGYEILSAIGHGVRYVRNYQNKS